MRTLLVILFSSLASFAQIADGKLTASASDKTCSPESGITINVSYVLPSSYKWDTSPAMAPGKVIWLWGDEERGAKTRNFTEAKYGDSLTHIYKKPGTYTVVAVITDQKNRNIDQRSAVVRINPLVEINPPKETR